MKIGELEMIARQDVAKLLGIAPSTVARIADRAGVNGTLIGRKVYYPKYAIEAAILANSRLHKDTED